MGFGWNCGEAFCHVCVCPDNLQDRRILLSHLPKIASVWNPEFLRTTVVGFCPMQAWQRWTCGPQAPTICIALHTIRLIRSEFGLARLSRFPTTGKHAA